VQRPVTAGDEVVLSGRRNPLLSSLNRSILRALITVAAAVVVARSASLLRELVVANEFGISDEVDAFLVALLIPTFAVAVLADSMNTALLPMFVRVRDNEGPAAAARMFASCTWLGVRFLAGASLVLAVTAPLLVRIVAPGFGDAKTELAVQLLWVMLPLVLLSGVLSIWTAALTAGQRFALPALAPVLVPVSVLVALGIAGHRPSIFVVAVGTAVGYALQLVPLMLALRRNQLPIVPRWHGRSPAIRKVLSEYAPLTVATMLSSGALLVDQAVASGLGDGAVSSLHYGNRLVQLVTGVVSLALGTAVMPYLSAQIAAGDWAAARRTLRFWSAVSLVAAGAVAAVLIVLSTPLIEVMFERGEFDAGDTDIVSTIQQLYLLQLPAYALGILGARMLSALQRNRTLLVISAFNLLLNGVLDVVLARTLGVAGIALATAGVYTVSAALVFVAIFRSARPVRPADAALGSVPVSEPGPGAASGPAYIRGMTNRDVHDGQEAPDSSQEAIWDYFQGEGVHSFAGSRARLAHLASLLPAASRVLDIGIGGGIFEEEAIRRGHEVYCLDPSEAAVRALRDRLNLGERAQIGYLQSMPFPDAHVDAVILSEVLEHLDEQIIALAVPEIARVLRPGGLLLVTVPAEEVLEEQRVVCPSCSHRFHRWGHVQSFDEHRLRAVLAPAFRVEQVDRRYLADASQLNWKGKALLGARAAARRVGVHGSGETFIVQARKA
jgi:putative peptidoglycan lipid II flippase